MNIFAFMKNGTKQYITAIQILIIRRKNGRRIEEHLISFLNRTKTAMPKNMETVMEKGIKTQAGFLKYSIAPLI